MLQMTPTKRRYGPFSWELSSVRKGTTVQVQGKSNCHRHCIPDCLTYKATDHRCYIHGLPFEILSGIFHLSLSWKSKLGEPDYLSHILFGDTPLSLLSVCRNWRAIALATPLLWNSIYPSWNSVPCMKFWLTVAPPIPFHLKIVEPVSSYGQYPQFPCMLQLFASVSHRWKSLSITLNHNLTKEFLSILQCPENAPLPVEELILDMSIEADLTNDDVSAILRQLPGPSLPQLKRLDLKINDKYKVDLRSIPWSTLEHIKLIHHLTTTEVFSCLTQLECMSARKVDFRGVVLLPQNQLRSDFLGKQPVTLPLLTSLTLSWGADPMTILQYLSLPSIQSLCIRFVNRNHLILDKFLARTPSLTLVILNDECRGPSEYRSAVASDEDIVTYLLDSHLRRIPSVYLSFREAQKRVPKIIEEYPNARDLFPQMICWEAIFDYEEIKKIPQCHYRLLGWNNNLDSHPNWRAYWQFRDGRVEPLPHRRQATL